MAYFFQSTKTSQPTTNTVRPKLYKYKHGFRTVIESLLDRPVLGKAISHVLILWVFAHHLFALAQGCAKKTGAEFSVPVFFNYF